MNNLERNIAEDFATLSEYMSLDEDLTVFRLFTKLGIYNVLSLQYQLKLLNDDVVRCEESGEFHKIGDLLQKARPLLKDYYKALLLQRNIEAIGKVSKEKSTFIRENAYSELVKQLDPAWSELIAVSVKPKGWLHMFIDRHPTLQRLFQIRKQETGRSNIIFYSEDLIRRTEEALVNIAFCCALIGPVCALTYVKSKGVAIAILVVSLLSTALITTVLSDKTRRSNLAVIAGYTAILVVFLGGETISN